MLVHSRGEETILYDTYSCNRITSDIEQNITRLHFHIVQLARLLIIDISQAIVREFKIQYILAAD